MIKKILYKIHMYFEGKRIWKAKMSEPLVARIVKEGLYMDMEIKCIQSLKAVLNRHFSDRLFNFDRYKEWAICMQKDDGKWLVYQAEKGNHYDEEVCLSVLEACLHIIRKATCLESEIALLDEEFYKELLSQQIYD